MDNPLVSVILTSFNQPGLLEIAFQSLLDQTYKNIEIIIVDDCSANPQNKSLILRFYADHPQRVRYLLHDKNIGISANKNSGFKLAKGEFITYLDGDDQYLPQKIALEINHFKKFPHLVSVYSNFEIVNSTNGKAEIWATGPMPEGMIFKEIVDEDFPGKVLFRFELVKAEAFKNNNFYDETLSIYEDWDFRMRYSFTGMVGYVDEVLSIYYRNENSVTINATLTQLIEHKRKVIEKNKALIASGPGTAHLYQKFNRESAVRGLFDFTISFKKYVSLFIFAIFVYPLSAQKILQSVKYRFKKKHKLF